MLPSCSMKLSQSPFPTPLVSEKFPVFSFNNRSVSVRLKSQKGYNKRQIFIKNIKCIHSPDKLISVNSNRESFLVSCLTTNGTPIQPVNVAEKVHCLASEFKSLSEPIDRVKRLLHYATLLPPFDESARVQENRVSGCTTMVWLEVQMDNNRLMRFRVDSDSEITKGFCSCLIWLFDGAAPEEVLSVKNDDLKEMNVGFTSRGHSRVNTWHNILISMQKRTRNLVEEKDREQSLNGFSPFVISPDAISVPRSYEEAQLRNWLMYIVEVDPMSVKALLILLHEPPVPVNISGFRRMNPSRRKERKMIVIGWMTDQEPTSVHLNLIHFRYFNLRAATKLMFMLP